MKGFAIDTNLYIIVKDSIDEIVNLNSDISKIYTWIYKYLVAFNPSESESMLFTRNFIRTYGPVVYMNNEEIKTMIHETPEGTFPFQYLAEKKLDSMLFKRDLYVDKTT